jgi:hypothetical protein
MGAFLDLTGIGWGIRACRDWVNLFKNWLKKTTGNVLNKMETLGLVRGSEVTVA